MWKFFPNSVYRIKSSLTAINNSQLLSPHCFMKVVAKGNANIVIDYGNPNWLYRCCVRYENSLKCNNDYSLENYQYIKSTVEPLLKGTLCDMELKTISLELLKPVISEYIAQMDDTKFWSSKCPILNLKILISRSMPIIIQKSTLQMTQDVFYGNSNPNGFIVSQIIVEIVLIVP